MSICFEIEKCEVCYSDDLVPVLDLGLHPMCDDLVEVGSTRECQKFPIDILYCNDCHTAHQRYQVPKDQLFPKNYHYRSRFTADVLSGMSALVESVEQNVGDIAGLTILDIGCNDGSLLDRFAAKGGKTIGVEPTGACADAEGRGHIIINDFFSQKVSEHIVRDHGHIDIITFTNVFAHIEDLPGLLNSLQTVMRDETVLVIENHYLGAVLSRNQFDTFYHEHPRTYSLHSFVKIAQTLGRNVIAVEFPQRYGGNVRVMIGKVGSASSENTQFIETALASEVTFCDKFTEMRVFMEQWRVEKRAQIDAAIKEHGKIIAKAFPGRSAILVELLGLTADEVECVYEKPGSLKIGHYLPGTKIPIRSDEELFAKIRDVPFMLNLAWHIPEEIETYLRSQHFTGNLLHIV